MYQSNEGRVKTADEIEMLVKQLTPANRLRMLSSMDALLYSQQMQREKTLKKNA